FKREQFLELPKTHYNDAVAICCEDGQTVKLDNTVYHKKHVPAGDYQQTKGARSEKKIPTGKVFGLRKYDFVKTEKGIGFIRGKRSTGYFTLCDIFGGMITTSVNIKKNCIRIRASSTTLIQAVNV
ncbi:MAG: HNH endonuclease, partial [Methanosarcinaceae archaeon]|nr:HNH endonuclease [Methanosarcinaceae archaeon]